jgi:diguanylate cyclase (GGDEF)-like protein
VTATAGGAAAAAAVATAGITSTELSGIESGADALSTRLALRSVAKPTLPPVSPLRGLVEVTSLVRRGDDLPELLAAIARVIAESLGYRTVAVNLYRPAWDDFYVSTVHGRAEAREALLGHVRTIEEWQPLLSERFARHGAYFVPAGEFDWTGADGWHPLDALFVPMRHHDGHLLGILSVDEPRTRRRPSDEELDVLVALADHASIAVQAAQEAAETARHKLALERLLDVSARLTGEVGTDEILRSVCTCVRDALGFQNVLTMLVDSGGMSLVSRAAVGPTSAQPPIQRPVRVAEIEALLDPAFEIEGSFLVPNDEVEQRISRDHIPHASQRNGRGPRAWNRHWLLTPLRDADGGLLGLISADEPEDRLLPSEEMLQALRIFANQAAAAVVASANLNELRFLADHDSLTRLLNRRAFVERLDAEVARVGRYGGGFALVLSDLDGFKAVNDSLGHSAGDEALQAFGAILARGLRRPDDAFRIGGDEFALLLVEAGEEDAREVLGRVRSGLDASGDDLLGGIRASFGVAACPTDATDAKSLFRLADEALYQAKRSGSGLQFV